MSEHGKDIGVFINNACGTRLGAEDAGQIADSIYFSGLVEKKNVLFQPSLGERGFSFIRDEARKRGFSKIVVAGYSPTYHAKSLERIEEILGPGTVRAVPLYPASDDSNGSDIIQRSASDIIRALRTLSLLPAFERKEISLSRKVLVVGGGAAGIESAFSCAKFGYEVIVIDQSHSLGGDLKFWSEIPLSRVFTSDEGVEGLEGVTVKTRTALVGLSGSVGNFTAVLEVNGQKGPRREKVGVGAIILSAGLKTDIDFPGDLYELMKSPAAEPLDHMAERVKSLPRKREIQNIGIALDLYNDETKASTEMALTIASAIQEEDRFQVHIFLRDVRVAAKGLQKYYDRVRDSGVNIVKYDKIDCKPGAEGIDVLVSDPILMQEVNFQCDLLGISGYGLPRAMDSELLEITGVLPDRTGKMQENNIHLFPVETNRPGIFTAGANRGTLYISTVIEEARAAAVKVNELLQAKKMTVVCSEAQVDPDKCVLCLTCVRCCPYDAMHVDRENGVAVSYPEECQKCGICAGECPAKAITLPEYSDEIIAVQLS